MSGAAIVFLGLCVLLAGPSTGRIGAELGHIATALTRIAAALEAREHQT